MHRLDSQEELLDSGLALFQETEASIAISSLVSPSWKYLSNDWVRTSLDQRVLVSF